MRAACCADGCFSFHPAALGLEAVNDCSRFRFQQPHLGPLSLGEVMLMAFSANPSPPFSLQDCGTTMSRHPGELSGFPEPVCVCSAGSSRGCYGEGWGLRGGQVHTLTVPAPSCRPPTPPAHAVFGSSSIPWFGPFRNPGKAPSLGHFSCFLLVF